MPISFKTLCGNLHLPTTYTQESNLVSLEAWCHEHISQDVHYTGSVQEKYSNYLKFAENYLDNFLAHLPNNREHKMSFFGNLSTIHYAAQQGYDRFITNLSEISEQLINEEDSCSMTPLHKAATQGHLFTVRALLAKGANVRKANAQMQLPIQSALFVPILHSNELLQRKEQIVRELLPLTPEALTMHDKDGNTLLHFLATHPFDNLIDELLHTNPKLAFVTNNASLYPIHTAILNHQLKAIDLLLAIDGVAALSDAKKCIPLHYAARYGTAAMVQSCCNVTTNINSRDGEEKTPLLWAACAGNQDALKVLIAKGADATLTDYHGRSILHFAINEQNESMVHWIVDNVGHFLLDQVDAEHRSPLSYAKNNNNQLIVAFLENKGATDLKTPRCEF